MAFADLQNKISSLSAVDFGEELFSIIDANTQLLADMQREQMATGLDANNEPVLATTGAGYTPYTIQVKKAIGVGLGAETSVVTNYMTGAFYNSLQKKVYSNGMIESDSNVPYFEEILSRSGEVAVDLNEDNRLEFAQTKVLPHINNLINGIFSK